MSGSYIPFEYHIVDAHDDDEWATLDSHANSYEWAAQEAGREFWEQDSDNPDDFAVTVRVRRKGESDYRSFAVTAEADVNFYAEHIVEDEVDAEKLD